jgi:hypothetical protein
VAKETDDPTPSELSQIPLSACHHQSRRMGCGDVGLLKKDQRAARENRSVFASVTVPAGLPPRIARASPAQQLANPRLSETPRPTHRPAMSALQTGPR